MTIKINYCQRQNLTMRTKIDHTGRLYIPKEVRDRVAAEEFTIETLEDGSIILRPIRTDPVDEYYGIVKTKPMSVEDMEKKIKEYVEALYRNDIS
ncbi:conserved hypothetical protein [Candidatus Caldarchaeum subterraneum]|uniref:SpoVT-AbrB domain-containing protein n=3 Tax=Thermoproteati TaxID=1783275 RepID=E6P7U6_CALS0|nr:conserved hypothetical protein [Candidatus Caldarchaeum subterraneum]